VAARSTAPPSTPAPSAFGTPDPFALQVLADDVQVTCGANAPALSSRRVRVSADGVRFVVAGQLGRILTVNDDRGGQSAELQSGSQTHQLLVPPGVASVSCSDPGQPVVPPTTPLRVEDPAGHYRSPEIDPTAGSCVTGFNEFEEGARGESGDPLQLAARQLTGLQPGDLVEAAGYPVEQGRVRIVRSGAVIGSLVFHPDDHDGWLLSETTLCGGLA
jgi:hypothetical protein